MLSEFTKKYNVKVQDVVVDYENINDKLAASMTSGDVIDVGFLYGAFFPAQVIANMYMQIDPYIKRDYMVDSSSAASLAKGGFDMNKMDFFKWNGHYYGFSSSWDVDILILYYNKRMFQAADGKTPMEHVKAGTWNLDTFYDTAVALTDEDAGVYGWSAGAENTGTGRGAFIYAYGTNTIKYDSNGKPQQNLGDPDVLKGFQFMQKLYYGAGKVVKGDANFYNGKAAMCTDGLYMSPKLMTNAKVPESVKKNWDIAPLPMAKGHEKDPYPADWLKSFGILRGSKNPDAAAAYAYYRTKYKMDNLYDEYLTAEQKEIVRPLYTKVNYHRSAFGDLGTKSSQMTAQICSGEDIAQLISENKSVFQAQIDRVLNG
jgi:ABC-type glycerol-3-phosphate transport system substrate-binding protein